MRANLARFSSSPSFFPSFSFPPPKKSHPKLQSSQQTLPPSFPYPFQSLENTGIQGFSVFLLKRKSQPWRAGKRERKREERVRILVWFWEEEGKVFCFFSGEFSWDLGECHSRSSLSCWQIIIYPDRTIKNRIKEQTEDLVRTHFARSSPFPSPFLPFSPSSPKTLISQSHPSQQTLLPSSFPNLFQSLENTGFQRFSFFFRRGKTSPEGLGKREKRREKMERVLRVCGGGRGRSFCFFLGFFLGNF